MEFSRNKITIAVISLILVLIAIVYAGTATVCAEEHTSTVSGYEELKAAVQQAEEGQEQTIDVTGSISVKEPVQIPANKKIRIITTDGAGTLEGVGEKFIFQVQEGGTLILDQDITLSKGLYVDCAGALIIEKATLTGASMSAGSVLRGKGAVNVEGNKASFVMKSGVIENTVIRGATSGVVRIAGGARGTITGGKLCNNELKNQMCGTLLIHNGGSCEMKNGEITDNKAEQQIQSSGGVLVMALDHSAATKKSGQEAHFTMDGGEISGNDSAFGGGVYVYGGNAANYGDLFSKAYFTMNQGTIQKNKATGYGNKEFTGGGGGGVYVECGGEFTMNGGSIIENVSYGEGGGVATYDQFVSVAGGKKQYSAYKGIPFLGREDISKWPEFFPAAFVMNGGEVSRNHAISNVNQGDNGCGGGIYCASSGVTLNAGKVQDNVADKQGGGIYVGSVPYILHMYDSLITNNEASVIGGGAWFCPTGDMSSFVQNGAALFNNTAKDAADDLAVVRNRGSYSTTTVADRILGGGKANWYKDGALDCSTVLGNGDASAARYQENSDKNIPVSNIKNSSAALALKAVPTQYAGKQAEVSAKLLVTGNKSARGGGLGSNGGMVIGKSYEAPQEISVEKVWKTGEENQDVSIPDSVTIWLVTTEGQRVDKVVLNADNNWTHTFKGLPSNIEYKVEEDPVDGWKGSYETSETPDGDKTFVVTNTYTPTVPDNPSEPQHPSVDKSVMETGDSAMPILWAILCGLAMAAAFVVLFSKKRRR